MIDFKTQMAQVLDRPLRCQICGDTRFWQGTAQLTLDGSDTELGPQGEISSRLRTRSVLYLSCGTCGYLHWFFKSDNIRCSDI